VRLGVLRFSASGAFPILGRWPVLVDFERSIVRRDDVRSTFSIA
jgi:hypothetical protein